MISSLNAVTKCLILSNLLTSIASNMTTFNPKVRFFGTPSIYTVTQKTGVQYSVLTTITQSKMYWNSKYWWVLLFYYQLLNFPKLSLEPHFDQKLSELFRKNLSNPVDEFIKSLLELNFYYKVMMSQIKGFSLSISWMTTNLSSPSSSFGESLMRSQIDKPVWA